MFDDPKKELKRLEQQLLAAEQDQEESDEAWFEEEEEQDWLETELREAHALLGNAPGRRSKPEDVFQFLEEDVQEEKPAFRAKRKRRKEKGTRGLVVLACLETAAIIALLLWWVVWLQ